MAYCMGLLSGPLDKDVLPNWITSDFFQDKILHVEKLTSQDTSDGKLTFDPFEIPPSIDVKDICGLVILNCETREVTRFGFQVPALGISCLKHANIICAAQWCEPEQLAQQQEYHSDCAVLDDPCQLYKELCCCLYKLDKEEQKVAIAFKDRRVQFQPKSEASIARLTEMKLQAKADCDAVCGKENNWRGGYLGHSCIRHTGRPCGCGCC